MKFDGYHLQHFGSQLVKNNCLYFCISEEIQLSIKPILRIHSYGILVSYSCDITMYEYKFWDSHPLSLYLQRNNAQPDLNNFEIIPSVSCCPRWPRQVHSQSLLPMFLIKKLCQCT
jgi:hypothetical protein